MQQKRYCVMWPSLTSAVQDWAINVTPMHEQSKQEEVCFVRQFKENLFRSMIRSGQINSGLLQRKLLVNVWAEVMLTSLTLKI